MEEKFFPMCVDTRLLSWWAYKYTIEKKGDGSSFGHYVWRSDAVGIEPYLTESIVYNEAY